MLPFKIFDLSYPDAIVFKSAALRFSQAIELPKYVKMMSKDKNKIFIKLNSRKNAKLHKSETMRENTV